MRLYSIMAWYAQFIVKTHLLSMLALKLTWQLFMRYHSKRLLLQKSYVQLKGQGQAKLQSVLYACLNFTSTQTEYFVKSDVIKLIYTTPYNVVMHE